ncbi:MAG: hypothetical protein L6Q77_09455 [Bacteroidetes bacterium]|nr:hypothetical protein [Bacteroidota bacterium]
MSSSANSKSVLFACAVAAALASPLNAMPYGSDLGSRAALRSEFTGEMAFGAASKAKDSTCGADTTKAKEAKCGAGASKSKDHKCAAADTTGSKKSTDKKDAKSGKAKDAKCGEGKCGN